MEKKRKQKGKRILSNRDENLLYEANRLLSEYAKAIEQAVAVDLEVYRMTIDWLHSFNEYSHDKRQTTNGKR